MDLKKQSEFIGSVQSMRLCQQNYWNILNQAKETKGAEATALFKLAKKQLKEVKKMEKKVDNYLKYGYSL